MSRRFSDGARYALPLLAAALVPGILLGRIAEGIASGLYALAASCAAYGLLPRRLRPAALFAVFLSVGLIAGYLGYHPAVPQEGTCAVDAIVCDTAEIDEDGRLVTRLTSVYLNGAPAGDAYWSCYPAEDPGLVPGMRVRMTADAYIPSGASNPGGFDFHDYLLAQGITYGLYGDTSLSVSDADRFSLKGSMAALRHLMAEKLRETMGSEAGSFAAAMLLGERSLIDDDALLSYRRLGLSHVLSVSGFHVGVLLAVLGLLTGALPRGVRRAVSIAVLALYCVLTGGHAPVLRASIVASFAMLAPAHYRRRRGLWLICASWSVMLLFRPAFLTSAGFQLTFGALLGILIFTPRFRLWLARFRLPQGLREAAAVAAAAQLGVAMPILWWYQELPLLSLAANILLLPVMTVLIGACWFTLPLAFVPGPGHALGAVSGLAVRAVNALIVRLGSLPGTEIWTKRPSRLTFLGFAVIVLLGADLLRLKRAPRRALLLAACAAILAGVVPLPHQGAEYIQFSVGNADCAVLWDRDTVWMIDAGYDSGDPASWLRQRRLGVDTLVITHLHKDHAFGAEKLLDRGIPVKRVLLAASAMRVQADADCVAVLERLRESGAEIVYAERGDVYPLPDGSVTVLWPDNARVRGNQKANPSSMVLRAAVMNTTLLLTGDMTGAGERYAAVPSDILKAAHHGAADANSAAFLEDVDPGAVILSGADEQRPDILRAKLGDTPLFATQAGGAVMIRFDPDGYTIRRLKGDP